MELKQVLHMNEGAGETSYAKNSSLQGRAIQKAKPIVEAAILDLYCTTFPKHIVIADLGCSSGPNALLVISEIIDAVDLKCYLMHHSFPEFQIFLNDLPWNDFNSIFRILPPFYEKRIKEKGHNSSPCFIAGVPGSFYGRLFPNKCLHFIHSSYSIHWLSQVPLGLESKECIALNKGNIYIANTSPPCAREAYLQQFQDDFSLFLTLRSQEMVNGGRMVLTLLGRQSPDPASKEFSYSWELLGEALKDMVSKGLIEEEKFDLFNIPIYAPSPEELKDVVEREGSFIVDRIEIFKLGLDGSDENSDSNYRSGGERATKIMRAISESMLKSQFGEDMMEVLFHRYQEIMTDRWSKGKIIVTNLVFSMQKKV